MKVGVPRGKSGSPERELYNAVVRQMYQNDPALREKRSRFGKAMREKDITAYRKKHRAYAREWRRKNAEYNRNRKRAFRRQNPVSTLLSEVKLRCKQRHLLFNLERCDITIPTRCPVFNTVLNDGTWANRASLDRVIPELGYVKGNVRVISMRANRLKSDATIGELRAIINYIESHSNGVPNTPGSLQRSDSGSTSAGANAGGSSADGGHPAAVRPSPETDR